MTQHYGASPADWRHFRDLGLGEHLLPVVSGPCEIAPKSALRSLGKVPSTYNANSQAVGCQFASKADPSFASKNDPLIDAGMSASARSRG